MQAAIAKKIARIHATDMPIAKTLKAYNWFIKELLDRLLRVKETVTILERDRAVAESVFEFDFKKEFEFVQKEVASLGVQPIVFCHRDVRRANILLKSPKKSPKKDTELPLEDRLVLLDIEFAGYGHRGFDLAKYLGGIMYRFGTDRWPHFEYDFNDIPDEHAQRVFIRAYVEELTRIKGSKFSKKIGNQEERIFQGLQCHFMNVCLFYALIVLSNAFHKSAYPDNNIGYWEGVQRMINSFCHFKEKWRKRNLNVN